MYAGHCPGRSAWAFIRSRGSVDETDIVRVMKEKEHVSFVVRGVG